MRFLLSLLLGVALGSGGYHLYRYLHARSADPCLDRCSEGTRCQAGRCVVVEDEPRARPHSKRRHGRRWSRAVAPAAESSGRAPTAAELQPRSEGPSLRGVEYVNAGEAEGGGRELGTAEIDARVRAVDEKVVACIESARGEVDYREGQVVLAFRIERSGRVEKVQVSAPSGLLHVGLVACLRAVATALSFPRSSRAVVMRYPYSLR